MSLIELSLATPMASTQVALARELDGKVGTHHARYRVNRNTRAFDDIMFVYSCTVRRSAWRRRSKSSPLASGWWHPAADRAGAHPRVVWSSVDVAASWSRGAHRRRNAGASALTRRRRDCWSSARAPGLSSRAGVRKCRRHRRILATAAGSRNCVVEVRGRPEQGAFLSVEAVVSLWHG